CRDARCVNDMGLDVARPEPACQPETVTAGLKSNRDALDPIPCIRRFLSPAMKQLQQGGLVDRELLSGWRSTPGTMPATSQLDRLISITAISVPSGSRGHGDRLKSFNFCKGRSIGSYLARMDAISSPPP